MRVKSGYILIIILTLIPIFRWIAMMSIAFRFSNYFNLMTSLGQLSALAGMVLFSINFILSARFSFLENMFGGMNRAYIAHHLIGGLAFLLLMIHPLFLGLSYFSISIKSAALFFLPGEDWIINLGISSLLLLMSLLFITYYADLRYQLWKLTHKFLGLAFFLGTLHAFFIPSDISRDPFLRSYMLTVIFTGLTVYLTRSLLSRYFIKKHRYTVKKINVLLNSVVEIDLAPVNEGMSFTPGQFVFINFNDGSIKNEAHPFSISSPPTQQELKLTVKSLGDFTNSLSRLTPGSQAQIEGPYGRFSFLDYTNRDQIWIAGGIGITPFLSMARILYNLDFKIDLFYSTSTENEAVYLEELTKIAESNPSFNIYPVITKVHGRLTAEIISATIGEITNKDFFICGPPPLMFSLKKQLKAAGIKSEQIHTEEFSIL